MGSYKTLVVNMGPQHPATHGVLRLVLELDGEVIVKCTPVIGHLHRGLEKLAESMTYHKVIPLTDRMDYTAASINNLGYCLAVEKLLGIEVPKRAQYIRVILAELARIMGHTLWLGTHSLDMGAMTPIFYCFRDREKVMRIMEEVTGYRLTQTFMRIGGVANDLTPKSIEMIRQFIKEFPDGIKEYEDLLTENPIWKLRTKGIGIMTKEDALAWGLTGPTLRGSGVRYDVRKAFPYSSYDDFDFIVPVGENGDVYDRYLVRIEEMRQSLRIISQAIENLPEGPVMVDDPVVALPPQDLVQEDPAALMRRFKWASEGFPVPEGEVYVSVEGSKGELGYYIVSDGGPKPFRMKVRSPCFIHVGALPKMVEGRMVADVVAVIGSIDIVLGEIDR